MKRLITLLALGLLLLPSATYADVNDFSFASFEADYYLSRDAQHNSQLSIEEHLVAVFPAIDQNHGILRAIPQSYEGHNVHLHIEGVSDGTGRDYPYSTYNSNGNLVLKIGDAGTYVHGLKTYDIKYRQDYVTTQGTNGDVFMWDTNGTGWSQTFAHVTAHVHLASDLATFLQSGSPTCYTGAQGSTQHQCAISTASDGTVTFSANDIGAGQTLTFRLDFADGTFAPYQTPLADTLLLLAKIALGLAPVLATLWFVSWRWWRYGRDPRGPGAIVPEYLPPKDASVVTSSMVFQERFQPQSISAQLIDLAVRHYLRVYEVKDVRTLLPDKTHYEFELIRDPGDLRPEELRTLRLVFSDSATPGTRATLQAPSELSQSAKVFGTQLGKDVAAAGFLRAAPDKARQPFAIAGTISFVIFLILSGNGSAFSLTFLACAIILFIGSAVMPARTAQGVQLRSYLQGLKLYIGMAEAERLRVLQSPHGELTEKVDVGDSTQLIKLYEQLLPYAMLFGLEKDWAKALAPLYQDPPDWYHSAGAFNAGYFVGSFSSFSDTTTASFTPPSSSGGGGAGGGGGGGGGGGW
ncbi:MAG TPA: DUF2207 domain-containing protein [Candidatus Saccharimonas sp.]|nr:DUF2207 domain-containing protein [Candidatus Saccharimonas sp.]